MKITKLIEKLSEYDSDTEVGIMDQNNIFDGDILIDYVNLDGNKAEYSSPEYKTKTIALLVF